MENNMHLVGLDDQVSDVNLTDIAIDQIGSLIKTVPPERWGDAAKQLPSDFVKQLCKQGAVDKASGFMQQYGFTLGVSAAAGLGVGLFTRNAGYAIAAAAAAGLVCYLTTKQ